MERLYYIIGKSNAGKDTIYARLKEKHTELIPLVQYTTRPKREGEEEGREYYFIPQDSFPLLEQMGSVIEKREYHTKNGLWSYATVDQEKFSGILFRDSCIAIGSLESYIQVRDYYGVDKVIPIYIEVDDFTRFIRAAGRESRQSTPNYEEMHRRFRADQSDFSEVRLKQAGISHSFYNYELEDCLAEISAYISKMENRQNKI